MRFPMKFALTAVLANGIVAELNQSPQPQQSTGNNVDLKYHQIQPEYQTDFQNQQQDSTFKSEPYVEANQVQPAYDSTKMAYHAYAPVPVLDPVQQYASSQFAYNQEQDADEGESTNEVSSVVDPYSVYSNGGYNPTAYNPAAFNPNQYNPGAFHVQSGYDGYLVPDPVGAGAAAAQQKEVVARNPTSVFSPLSNTFSAISNSIPSSMREATSLLSRSFAFLMSLLGITVFGGGITTALCTFTPLCTISFAIPFVLRSGVRETAESVLGKNAESFVQAFEKFSKFDSNKNVQTVAKSDSIIPEAIAKTVATNEKASESSEKVELSEKSDIPVSSTSNNSSK